MFRLSRAPVTASLLVVITLLFVVELVLGAPSLGASLAAFVADVDPNVLHAMGGITSEALAGQYWRLFAAMFLHASVLHWLTNSWSLYQLGAAYEAMFGSRRLALVYVVTGICASLASAAYIAPGGISVGASGAILGILGAFIFSIRRSFWRHERWTRGLINQLVFWGLLNVTLPFYVPVIDNRAHIAGVVSGLLLGLLLPRPTPPPPRPAETLIDVRPYEPSTLPHDQP